MPSTIGCIIQFLPNAFYHTHTLSSSVFAARCIFLCWQLSGYWRRCYLMYVVIFSTSYLISSPSATSQLGRGNVFLYPFKQFFLICTLCNGVFSFVPNMYQLARAELWCTYGAVCMRLQKHYVKVSVVLSFVEAVLLLLYLQASRRFLAHSNAMFPLTNSLIIPEGIRVNLRLMTDFFLCFSTAHSTFTLDLRTLFISSWFYSNGCFINYLYNICSTHCFHFCIQHHYICPLQQIERILIYGGVAAYSLMGSKYY